MLSPEPAFDSPELREQVAARMRECITRFARNNLGMAFKLEQLSRYVLAEVQHASPDSPGRIFRMLREIGELNYSCTDRARSTYRIHWVK